MVWGKGVISWVCGSFFFSVSFCGSLFLFLEEGRQNLFWASRTDLFFELSITKGATLVHKSRSDMWGENGTLEREIRSRVGSVVGEVSRQKPGCPNEFPNVIETDIGPRGLGGSRSRMADWNGEETVGALGELVEKVCRHETRKECARWPDFSVELVAMRVQRFF